MFADLIAAWNSASWTTPARWNDPDYESSEERISVTRARVILGGNLLLPRSISVFLKSTAFAGKIGFPGLDPDTGFDGEWHLTAEVEAAPGETVAILGDVPNVNDAIGSANPTYIWGASGSRNYGVKLRSRVDFNQLLNTP